MCLESDAGRADQSPTFFLATIESDSPVDYVSALTQTETAEIGIGDAVLGFESSPAECSKFIRCRAHLRTCRAVFLAKAATFPIMQILTPLLSCGPKAVDRCVDGEETLRLP